MDSAKLTLINSLFAPALPQDAERAAFSQTTPAEFQELQAYVEQDLAARLAKTLEDSTQGERDIVFAKGKMDFLADCAVKRLNFVNNLAKCGADETALKSRIDQLVERYSSQLAMVEDIHPYAGAVRAKNMIVSLVDASIAKKDLRDLETVLGFCDGSITLFEAVRRAEYALDFRYSREEFTQLVNCFRDLEKAGAIRIVPKYVTTPEQFREALVKLGVKPKMKLLMHSSYTSLGKIAGGREAVLKMLQELLTPEGVLMLPTFNFYNFNEDGVYDPKTTPCVIGAFPNAFRIMPDVHRSLSPTHSFAAWGKDAEKYVKNHHLVETMGDGSPMDLLAKDDGWILLVDCPTTVTYMHFVEFKQHAPCIHPAGEAYPVRFPDGTVKPVKTWSWRNGHCIPAELRETWKLMRKNNWLKEGDFANAHLMLFQFNTFEKCHAEVLQRHGNCDTCPHRPRLVENTLPELKELFAKYNK